MTWFDCPNCGHFHYGEAPPAKCRACKKKWEIDLKALLAKTYCSACGCHYSGEHTHDPVLHGRGRRAA